MQHVGEHCGDREDQSKNIQPKGGMDRPSYILVKAELKQERGQPDRGDYYQGEWTEEGAVTGVDDNQSEGDQEKSSRDDGPAARRLGRFDRGFGQGVVIQRARPVFNVNWLSCPATKEASSFMSCVRSRHHRRAILRFSDPRD